MSDVDREGDVSTEAVRFGERQRSMGMTEETEDRVLLLAESAGVSASAVMRQALKIGMQELDPQGTISGYRDPERRVHAQAIRATLRKRRQGGHPTGQSIPLAA